jgi:hypothetical protein
MTKISFLDKIAAILIDNYSDNLSNTIVILPNKRAKVFLVEAIKNKVTHTVLSPEIISIEDFIQNIAGIRSVDSIEQLFEFYDVYLSITPSAQQQSFELFANWAKILLQDFNEIDRYLLDPNHVLSYLNDIEDIKKWGIEVEDKTKLLENYIDFWKLLPKYYQSLYDHMLSKGIGYHFRERHHQIPIMRCVRQQTYSLHLMLEDQ